MKLALPVCGALALLLAVSPAIHAENGDCGIPFTSGAVPKASDALFVLRSAVGLVDCALCVCDVNSSDEITTTDALLDLRKVVGQNVALDCPACTASGVCPAVVEWTTHSGYGGACSKNADCAAGACIGGSCRTGTRIDIGWTGTGHGGDLSDGSTLRLEVDCPGNGGSCGDCVVSGFDTSDGSCRCANDSRRTCDGAFGPDSGDCPACFAGAYVGFACSSNVDCDAGTCSRRCDNDPSIVCERGSDCGGGTCVQAKKCSNGKGCFVDTDCTGTCTAASPCTCYDGPPAPLSVAGTPFCLLSELKEPITGTVNVDTGSSRLTKTIELIDYNGSAAAPCPVCGGQCSDDPDTLCRFDSDCTGGTCTFDPVAGDGVQGGRCVGGGDNGLPCDIHAESASLPSSVGERGGGYSLDCSPRNGANATGPGAPVTVIESTGGSELESNLACGDGLSCPCLVCSTDASVACRSDADCTGVAGVCNSSGTLPLPLPDQCEGHLCSNGLCSTGPDDAFCDDVVDARGQGLVRCDDNADCGAGSCSLIERRACFGETIVASGDADSRRPVTAAAFCVPPIASAAKNGTIGLPGPARLIRQTRLRSYCASDGEVMYKPGAGGCPVP
jgi:hypothetical protein